MLDETIPSSKILEDVRVYYSFELKKRIVEELFYNAYRTIKSVYLFKNFREYVTQLKSDSNTDKKEEYWNAAYYEKLTDYIKITVAFENFNKAILLEKGFLVHKIQKNSITKELAKRQNNTEPIRVEDFLAICSFKRDNRLGKYYLEGLRNGFPTVTFSETLSENYQNIIQLNAELVFRLREINNNRNKLHFFTDFKGAYSVDSHIEKWKFIMDESIQTIEKKLKIPST